MKITAGINVIVKGRVQLCRVQFDRTAGADWEATVISGHNLERIGGIKAITVTPDKHDWVFSDTADCAGNAARALSMFGLH